MNIFADEWNNTFIDNQQDFMFGSNGDHRESNEEEEETEDVANPEKKKKKKNKKKSRSPQSHEHSIENTAIDGVCTLLFASIVSFFYFWLLVCR